MRKARTFYLHTFGCQMNELDSELVAQKLREEGYHAVSRPDEADYILINTCTVREKAAEKALHMVHTWAKRGKTTVVLGCLAQMMKDRLLAHGAEMVFGPRSYQVLPQALREYEMGILDQRVMCEDFGSLDFSERRQVRPGQVSAFVTIQEGCDNFCTFCIVPRTRGREVSRPAGKILQEVLALERQGVLEITLLGQNVDSYFDGHFDFPELLTLLDRRTHHIRRIRFTSPHPRDITYKLLRVIRDSERITDWIHYPLQAGSTRILARMQRDYTKEEFIEGARMIRQILPEATITTDIMVGFPGETERDFQDTLDVVRAVEFDGAYTFIYSPREGTAAARMVDQVDEEVKGRRLRVLIEEVNRVVRKRREAMLGKEYEIMIEGTSRKRAEEVAGRTRGNIKGVVPGYYPPGTFLRARVREIRGLTPVFEPLEVLFEPDELAFLSSLQNA